MDRGVAIAEKRKRNCKERFERETAEIVYIKDSSTSLRASIKITVAYCI